MKKHFLRNLLLMVVMLSIKMSFVSFAGGSWGDRMEMAGFIQQMAEVT